MASRQVVSTLDLVHSVENLVAEVDLPSWKEARRVLWEDPLPIGTARDPVESVDRIERAHSELRRIVADLAERQPFVSDVEELARRIV